MVVDQSLMNPVVKLRDKSSKNHLYPQVVKGYTKQTNKQKM